MATPTYVPISTTTLGTAAASVSLSSIPSTYTDLVVVMKAKIAAQKSVLLQFNADGGTNYSSQYNYYEGSVIQYGIYNQTTAYCTEFKDNSLVIINVADYTSTNKHKTLHARGVYMSTGAGMSVSTWASTTAITSILLKPDSGNLDAGTSISLYGIKAA